MIRVGIIGCNFGSAVLLPAFRVDPRCDVLALAGRNSMRVAELAATANVPKAYGDWRELVEDSQVEAVAIAVIPTLQAQVATYALQLGKPVFAEKPMAACFDDARVMLRHAMLSRLPTIVDFNFHQITNWQRAKVMINEGAIGALRHVVVNWHVETRAVQTGARNWKTVGEDGGGVLGNLVSHCFHYLEWACGPIARLTARLSGLPAKDDLQTTAAITAELSSGSSAALSVSCASYLGGGHRIEFYGDEGTLVLDNPGPDYMRGFNLLHARRPAAALARMTVEDPLDAKYPDGRIAPVSRLAKHFFDAIESGIPTRPGFVEGYRVQQLIDAAQRSNRHGTAIEVGAIGEESV